MLTTELLLAEYSRGRFPMMHHPLPTSPGGGGGRLEWHDPDPRAIFPLDHIAPNARLRTFIRTCGYRCTIDQRFEEVMRACADRENTWINEEMIAAYVVLHTAGHALSVETWKDDDLIGGIYGARIGRAFFGESMFSRKSNASKVAFYFLVDHLKTTGFTLFDTQYLNEHTASLGAVEVTREEFRRRLAAAIG